MNRGVLIGLLLLVAAAVGGVLVLSGPGEQPDPLGGYESPGQDDSSESGPQVAQPGGTGNRTASEPVLDEQLQADPAAVVGQVFGPDGRPIDRARLVFAHQQFGGAELGWSYEAVMRVGKGADAQGRFKLPIEGGKSRDLTVLAVAPGCVPERVEGVAAGEVIQFRLREQLRVPGTVLDPQGKPAAGIPVELFDPASRMDGLPAIGVSDAQGRFELRSPGPGTYSLRVRSALGSEFRQDGYVITQDAEPVQIRLQGSLALQVQLRDAQGAPVPGASLELRRQPASRPLQAAADDQGVVRAAGLAVGRWEARVTAEGFAPLRRQIDYQGASLIEDWTLERYASLEARVVNGKGRALPGTELRLLPDPALRVPRDEILTVTTDLEGRAVFESIVPGSYVLTPEQRPGHNPLQLFESPESGGAEGAAEFARLLEFSGGQARSEELVLRRHGFLNMTVVQNGKPVVGARGVLFRGIATQRKEIPALDLSDLDGLLVFPSVWAGEYEVEVQGSPSQLPVRRSLKVGRGGNKETLALPTGTLSGTVIGPQGPAAGAVVLAAPQGGKLRELMRTDAQGRFELGGLEAASYQLRIEAENSVAWTLTDYRHSGGALDLGRIELGVRYALHGTVENLPDGDAFFGPVLTIANSQGEPVKSVPLSGEGAFRVDELAEGSYSIEVYHAGNRIYEQRVSLPGAELPIKIRLP
ncbi:MAG: hypothetical protein CMJ94_04450 [Planctomycetes bacterium]|nr:hypothetical protein [Planctomycetota bacterium]